VKKSIGRRIEDKGDLGKYMRLEVKSEMSSELIREVKWGGKGKRGEGGRELS
jgi:hypothetical protein